MRSIARGQVYFSIDSPNVGEAVSDVLLQDKLFIPFSVVPADPCPDLVAHTGRIGERLFRFSSGTRAFWSLVKAVQSNFCTPSLNKRMTLWPTQQKKNLLDTFPSYLILNDRGKLLSQYSNSLDIIP